MPHVFITTDTVEMCNVNDYWREIASIFYEAYSETSGDIMRGSVSSFLLEDIVMFSADYDTHGGERDSRFIGRLDGAQYYIQLVTSGSVSGISNDKVFFASTGDIYISDVRMSTKMTSKSGSTISVIVDYQILQRILGNRSLNGIVLSGKTPKGRIISSMFRDVYSALANGHREEVVDLKDALISIIVCSFSETTPLSLYNNIKRRAVEYIHDHLSDDKIHVTSLCKALRISRSHLYRSFEDEGGIAVYIRKQRTTNSFRLINEKGTQLTKKQGHTLEYSDHSKLVTTQHEKFGWLPCRSPDEFIGKFIPQREAIGYHKYLNIKSHSF